MINFLTRKVIATAAQFVDDNAATFIEGGEALHKLFRNFDLSLFPGSGCTQDQYPSNSAALKRIGGYLI
ncbi:MAG: hypothetical protein H8E17_07535 [Deltaproteobacteria bacterium]|nr:hypothetical protein [Deltaproteobacteria bacterium]